MVFEDLVGEGNLGLIRATEEFEPRFGTRFSTYASYWIKQSIRHALINTTSTIRLPAHMVGLLSKWRRAERALCRERGHAPSFSDVATLLGIERDPEILGGQSLEGSAGEAREQHGPGPWTVVAGGRMGSVPAARGDAGSRRRTPDSVAPHGTTRPARANDPQFALWPGRERCRSRSRRSVAAWESPGNGCVRSSFVPCASWKIAGKSAGTIVARNRARGREAAGRTRWPMLRRRRRQFLVEGLELGFRTALEPERSVILVVVKTRLS